MTDRPQAASAWHQSEQEPYGGRVEFLFLRRTMTSDALGV